MMTSLDVVLLAVALITQGANSAPANHLKGTELGQQLDRLVQLLQIRGVKDGSNDVERAESTRTLANPYQTTDMAIRSNQIDYLQAYGYMDDVSGEVTDEDLSAAIRKFQNKWDLQEIGLMNAETQTLLEQPRCGCPDFPRTSNASSQSKRFLTHGLGGWTKNDLTYKVINVSLSVAQDVTDDVIERALAEWSNVTPLTFTETSGQADLDIFFVSGDHEDGYAFDGRGGVLAHAFFPAFGGDAHFDDDENWTVDGNGVGIDLMWVSVHEFGHSLGLSHSDIYGAIMYPFYSYQSPFSLHADDIAGIQSLYGANEEPDTTTSESDATTEQTATTESPITESCLFANMDAITSDKSGNLFIFHGDNYTLVDHKGMVDGFPRNISIDFPEITGMVDAAVYLPQVIKDKCITKNGVPRCYTAVGKEEVFIFAGEFYYRYVTGYLESKRMKQMGLIADKFVGFPVGRSLDAAFTYDGTDIYLVSGDDVWKQIRGQKKVDSDSPLSLTDDLVYEMPVPNAVLSLPTTSTYYNYFFDGDQYHRTTNGGVQSDNVQPPYPRQISQYWCDANLSNDLGYFKHHSVFVEKNGDRIVIPGEINI